MRRKCGCDINARQFSPTPENEKYFFFFSFDAMPVEQRQSRTSLPFEEGKRSNTSAVLPLLAHTHTHKDTIKVNKHTVKEVELERIGVGGVCASPTVFHDFTTNPGL